MTVFERPLVALSLSSSDQGLLAYAEMLAQSLDWSDIVFAHVGANDSQSSLVPLGEAVRAVFGEPTPAREHIHLTTSGARLDQLLGVAVKKHRDLILLGHRRSRSGRRSLARRLAMIAPASVWLVPEGSPAKLDEILVPIDFSDHSADSLAVAAGIATARGIGTIRAVHVFFDLSTVRYDEHVEEIRGQEEAAFARFIEPIDLQGVEVEPVFIEGTQTARDILGLAERSGADLIVMGTRGRSHAASVLLGSVTSNAMANSKIPLLAIKHFGSRMSLREVLLNHCVWDQPSPKTN